jgi:hypothetical protein
MNKSIPAPQPIPSSLTTPVRTQQQRTLGTSSALKSSNTQISSARKIGKESSATPNTTHAKNDSFQTPSGGVSKSIRGIASTVDNTASNHMNMLSTASRATPVTKQSTRPDADISRKANAVAPTVLTGNLSITTSSPSSSFLKAESPFAYVEKPSSSSRTSPYKSNRSNIDGTNSRTITGQLNITNNSVAAISNMNPPVDDNGINSNLTAAARHRAEVLSRARAHVKSAVVSSSSATETISGAITLLTNKNTNTTALINTQNSSKHQAISPKRLATNPFSNLLSKK